MTKRNLLHYFKGQITNLSFQSKDRFVIGQWKNNQTLSTNIMWADLHNERYLLTDDPKMIDFLPQYYQFDHLILTKDLQFQKKNSGFELCATFDKNNKDNILKLSYEFYYYPFFYFPIERPLKFNQYIENTFAQLLGTKTCNIQKNYQQYYNIEKMNFVTQSQGNLNGADLGDRALFLPKAGFGFSEPMKYNTAMQVASYVYG